MTLTRDILKLHSDGVHQAEIARQLGCTAANVSLTIKRHGVWDHTVRGMPLVQQQWLIDRARTLRQHPGDVAALLLKEIIDLYRLGDL